MPIEIRELVIRAAIEPGEKEKSEAGGAAPGPLKQELVAECVEQVLEILRQRGER